MNEAGRMKVAIYLSLSVGLLCAAVLLWPEVDQRPEANASLEWRPGKYEWTFVDEAGPSELQIALDDENKPLFRKVYREQQHMVIAEISPYLMNPGNGLGARELTFADLPDVTGDVRELLVLTAYWFDQHCDPEGGRTYSAEALSCRRWGADAGLSTLNIRQADASADLPTWQQAFGAHHVDFYLWDDDLDAYWAFSRQARAQP